MSYFTCLEGSGRLDLSYFTCLEGSGRLNVSYFTCLEAQNVDKYITFAWFSGWKAPGVKINRILRVWKALGGLKCRILRVWKLKTSKNTSHLLLFLKA